MKICVIGKYPPIEGGVSAQTYWLARGLAERGHEIHVVTNADEVEDAFRIALEADDWAWYQPEYERNGGRVRVHNTETFSPRRMGHIPASNPFVSKLASLATDVIRSHGCEVIFAYYYEPYAVAGWMASRWTGRPLLVKHAGSDLDRLFRVPDLATTYKEILRSADAVITQPRLMPRFLGMGVSQDRLFADVPYSLPPEVFHPAAEPLDVARVAISDTVDGTPRRSAFNSQIPSIGIYGKIGSPKGTFDLITALGGLAREDIEFNFLAMIGPAQGERVANALREAGISERTWILPLLPNWKVPAFIRACSAVCFLERDFPVAIHGPIVPREVLACGTCLVLSGEIAGKQWYREEFAPGENVLIVDDPKDHASLAAALRSVLTNPGRAVAIGEKGVQVSDTLELHQAFVLGWECLFERYAGDGSTVPRADAPTSRETANPTAVNLQSMVPELVALLNRRCAGLVDEFVQAPEDGNAFGTAIELCDFATERLGRETSSEDLKKLSVAVRYLKARLTAAHDPLGQHAPEFVVTDSLHGESISQESIWNLWPVRGTSVRIEQFEYDVTAVFPPLGLSGLLPGDDDGVDLTTVGGAPMLVLFQRSVNLVARELRVDEATRQLVDRCDGTRTTGEVVDAMSRYFGLETSPQREEVAQHVVRALDRLYQAGVIVFGERRPGWGWTGGTRGPVERVGGTAHGTDFGS